MDPAIFFPDPVPGDASIYDKAKAVCSRCPVTRECLAEGAVVGDSLGVRGGLSASERRRAGWGRPEVAA